jgi:hypothetical protein
MESYARALSSAKEQGVLPPERLNQLQTAFVATDSTGGRWTVDPRSGQWHHIEEQRSPAPPPAELFLDSETIFALEALGVSYPGPPRAAAQSSSAATPNGGAAAPNGAPEPVEPRPLESSRAAPRRFAPAPLEPEADWSPALLSLALAAFFAALGHFGESGFAYAIAALFTLLLPVFAAMNLTTKPS